MFTGWDTNSVQFYVIAGLIATLGSALVYIHLQLVAKVDRIEEKIDQNERRNQADHAKVDASLVRLEVGVRSIVKDVDRHDRDIDELKRRED